MIIDKEYLVDVLRPVFPPSNSDTPRPSQFGSEATRAESSFRAGRRQSASPAPLAYTRIEKRLSLRLRWNSLDAPEVHVFSRGEGRAVLAEPICEETSMASLWLKGVGGKEVAPTVPFRHVLPDGTWDTLIFEFVSTMDAQRYCEQSNMRLFHAYPDSPPRPQSQSRYHSRTPSTLRQYSDSDESSDGSSVFSSSPPSFYQSAEPWKS